MRGIVRIVLLGWILTLSAGAGFAVMEIDRADLIVRCTEYGVWIEGDLDAQVSATIDYEIFLTPTRPGDPTFMISGSEEVVGDANARFFLRKIEVAAEKICGSYNIKAHAEINGINRVDMVVVEPVGGFLECFCGDIGDFVWQDENGNGVQDAGEPGLEGVGLRMHGFGTDGRIIERMATTDADGLYRFEDLCPGTFRVDLLEDTLPMGLQPTEPNVGDDSLDSDGPLDGGFVTVEVPDERDPDVLTIDFGYVEENMACTGRIGDFVWRDVNQNGLQDPDDPAIQGVVVDLFDDSGTMIGSRETNFEGLYTFTGLCAGDYSVAYDPSSVPVGLVPTTVDAGDDALDSDPSPQAVTLPTDASTDLTNDFGFIAEVTDCTGAIGDFVWEDLEQDGVQNPEDPGLEDVRVILRDQSGSEIADQRSDADGAYLFEGLCAGNYTVEWDPSTLPTGYDVTLLDIGDDTLDADDSPAAVQLPADDSTDITIDFGFFEQGVNL